MGKTKEKERIHSILSASGSHKWLNCTPSARLEEELPDKEGIAAAEGTLAHSLCELKLTKAFTDQNMSTRTYNSRLKKIQENELYQPEMERFTDEYVDYIKEIAYAMPTAPTMVIEKKVDYSNYAPEGFGTADCLMLQGNVLHVVDFKYGKGVPVSAGAQKYIDGKVSNAEGNPQLALYALGALSEYGFIYPVEKIVLHVVQPRIGNFDSWETSAREILAWGNWVKERAELAYKGEGAFHEGPWCDSCFCKISGTCRHRAEKHLSLLEEATDDKGYPKEPATLSDEEVGAILKKARFLASWVKKLEGYAQNKLLEGGTIPGWKLVEGRSNRAFSDVDAAYKALQQVGYDRSLLYEEKPVTLTEAEKIVDKADWNKHVAAYIIKPPGKPTLVAADDNRPEYKPIPDVQTAFGGDNQYKEET